MNIATGQLAAAPAPPRAIQQHVHGGRGELARDHGRVLGEARGIPQPQGDERGSPGVLGAGRGGSGATGLRRSCLRLGRGEEQRAAGEQRADSCQAVQRERLGHGASTSGRDQGTRTRRASAEEDSLWGEKRVAGTTLQCGTDERKSRVLAAAIQRNGAVAPCEQ